MGVLLLVGRLNVAQNGGPQPVMVGRVHRRLLLLAMLIGRPRRRRSVAVGSAVLLASTVVVANWGVLAGPVGAAVEQIDTGVRAGVLGGPGAGTVPGAPVAPGPASLRWSTAFLDATLPAPPAYLDGAPVVYLTFDDGPSPQHTGALLAMLGRHHSHATFFVIGETAAAYPGLVRMEILAGDSVGGHSWTHPHLTRLSVSAITAQLASTQALVRQLGAPGRCFRPPYGQTNPAVAAVARSLHLQTYLWTTASNDFTGETASVDLARALSGLHPGAVIVFHDWAPQSLQAVDQFLTIAQLRGYVAAALPC